jgi:hypothetical protein
MPTPQELIQQKLFQLEQSTPNFHILTPQQLEKLTNIPEAQWNHYLNQEATRQRIAQRMNEDFEIAHRQALTALAKEASKGNVQAIKEFNALSGILNQNNNKQIVTHYIPRPKIGGETGT